MTMYRADVLPRTRVTDSMSGPNESQHTVKKHMGDKDV